MAAPTQPVGPDTALTRPVPLSRVWTGRRILAEDLGGDDLADVMQLHSDASAWWVLSRDPEQAGAELKEISKALDLDHTVMADLLATDRRAKFEQLGTTRLVLTNAATLDVDQTRLVVDSVSLLVTDRAIICFANPGAAFNPARELAGCQEQLVEGGVEAGLRMLLRKIVESYEAVVEWLEDASDGLANALFEERPLNRDEQIWAFRLRTVLSQLRRLTDPMRTVFSELTDSYASRAGQADRRWTMLTEHHHRVANAADAMRDALGSVFDTSLALADLRMNQIMKKLSGWAAVLAVPTLVTGFVGMNVTFPLNGTSVGFWLYLGIMALVSGLVYLIFKRKDWI